MKYNDKLESVLKKIYINGEYVNSEDGTLFNTINPAKQEIIGEIVASSKKDVDRAVQAAKKAENTWRTMADSERQKIMYKFAELIDINTHWLAYFEAINTGKPLKIAQNQDLPFTAQIYRYFAGQADKIQGKTLTLTKPMFGYTLKEPIGVVAQIIPWNYPLLMMSWKMAPALAAGCTIVLKPAEQSPLTALMLGSLINQAGFPAGTINIITGFGETGAQLTQHPLINKISFTGSTQVGYLIMRNSHKFNLKPITLQLGGKSANIIFPDANIDQAVEQASILFSNSGQSCVAGSRTFVHDDIYDQFVQKVKILASKIIVGDPMNQKTQQGSIISKQQFDKIIHYIQSGKQEGAKLIYGGMRIGIKGYFISPTIFSEVKDEMKIAKEEIFGPVMCIFRWKDEEQVIKRANYLPYGLGAGIVTNDINKITKFSRELKAGTIYVNCYDYQEGSTPFGGVKDSGFGKDLGDQGIDSYLITKTIIIKPKM